ncbi:alpha/beta fold hydrolase [Piscinibacter defluvii]|uniref:alpha/beta fold hydrolase n=1 Tax=Piscinibacter defluvii TaxID=1796922 RepID=UPI000FDF4116|nr:alpha/beta fold hydrolase [Piscinibacter defluvii]
MPGSALHEDTPPLATHALPVGHGHVLHVAEHGVADGLPALVLHGGPGSGGTPLLRRFFDPRRWRIVCPDQRGAGRSTPRGATDHNTMAELLDDLRRVREALGIERWLVVGGSWGATLAIAHAAAEPSAIDGLLLRATFLARREDIEAFAAAADLDLAALAHALHGTDRSAARQAARRWWRAEQQLAGTAPGEPDAAQLDALVDRYRVQSHYLRADCFLAESPLLARCAALPQVPTLLLHGSADRICPPAGARLVAAALPHARLRWVEGAGHDPTHPAMVAAMVRALERFAADGRFDEPAA